MAGLQQAVNNRTETTAAQNRVGVGHQLERRICSCCGRTCYVNSDAGILAEENEAATIERLLTSIAQEGRSFTSNQTDEVLARLAMVALSSPNGSADNKVRNTLVVLQRVFPNVFPQTVEEFYQLCTREKAFARFWPCSHCYELNKTSRKSKRVNLNRDLTCKWCKRQTSRNWLAIQLAKKLNKNPSRLIPQMSVFNVIVLCFVWIFIYTSM